MRIGLHARWVSWLALLCACAWGQSGTETPAPLDSGMTFRPDTGAPFSKPDGDVWTTFTNTPCPCTLAGRNALLHVKLIEVSNCEVRATVLELLAVAPNVTLEVEPGDVLDARRLSNECNAPSLEEGSEALLVYAPPASAGGEAEALLGTWGDAHVFRAPAGALSLPAGERELLLDTAQCMSRFGGGARAAPAASVTCSVASDERSARE